MLENAEICAGFLRRFVTLNCQISRFSPSGTKYLVSALILSKVEPMMLYPMPCRQLYCSASCRVGCQEGDQKRPLALSRR